MENKDLHTLYTSLVDKVLEEDMAEQVYYLNMVSESRNIPVEYLLEFGCIFVPNDEYIRYFLGNDAYSSRAGFYYNNHCNWTHFVMIPIRDLSGTIAGIVGWDAENKFKVLSGEEVGMPMYQVSNKHIFPREKYFLTSPTLLHQTFNTKTIFVVDGVFDCLSLCYHGIPTIGLLGSSTSKEILYFLRWYQSVYVVADNDDAGQKLYKALKASIPNVYYAMQRGAKDIEETLRTHSSTIIPQLKALLGTKGHDTLLTLGALRPQGARSAPWQHTPTTPTTPTFKSRFI